jgi:hypothetical protein
VNIPELDGKRFTLWLTDKDDESAVFSGTARWDGSTLVLERKPKPAFEIRSEWHERIRAVTNEESRKTLLGAEYFLRLFVGDVPKGEIEIVFEKTGLKWPD